MKLHLGFTLHFGKENEAPLLGKLFYTETNKGPQHVIEIHNPKQAGEFIRGLLPPYPAEDMSKAEKKGQDYHG